MVDRPFLFAIVDEKSGGVPLFAGKIMDPTGDLHAHARRRGSGASVPYVAHLYSECIPCVAGGQGQRLKLQEDKETENVLLQARRSDEAARETKATTASGQTRTEEEDYEE